MNTVKYIAILHDNLYQSTFLFLEEVDKQFIFQQDNAPAHSAKKTKIYMKPRGIATLLLPPNSPDLNIIENAWNYIKNQLKNDPCGLPINRDDLVSRVLEE